MAAFFVSCIVWIVCSQAITSTDQPSLVVNYHANHSPKCNSHTLLSTNPDANYAGAYYTNDNVSAIVELIDCHKPCFHPSVVQFSSLFSKTHVQKDVESDDEVNAISSYEPKSINFTAPFLPLSSKKQIEKWVDSIVADSMLNDIIDTHTSNNGLNTPMTIASPTRTPIEALYNPLKQNRITLIQLYSNHLYSCGHSFWCICVAITPITIVLIHFIQFVNKRPCSIFQLLYNIVV
eukprot:237515_1